MDYFILFFSIALVFILIKNADPYEHDKNNSIHRVLPHNHNGYVDSHWENFKVITQN